MFKGLMALSASVSSPQTSLPPSLPSANEWPEAKPGRVIQAPDWSDYRLYPAEAQRKGQEGLVTPEVLIGPDGKPQACRILKSSNFSELDAGTCQLMMQIRFEPSRDAAGAAVPSRFSRDVIWILGDPRPFASSVLRARVDIAGGDQTRCEVLGGGGPYFAAWSALACPILTGVSYYFGIHANDTAHAYVDFRLDAGDQASILTQPLPPGDPITSEKLTFGIGPVGNPSNCVAIEHRGFGPEDVSNTICGSFLNLLYFELPKLGKGSPVTGTFETRIYLLPNAGRAPPAGK
jgi:TonB family protein